MNVAARLASLVLTSSFLLAQTLVAQRAPAAQSSWQRLFDGKTLTGWHGFKTPGKVPTGWLVEDDAISPDKPGDDLVTDKTYRNFELRLEWKISPKGNSGIIYRIDPKAEVTYISGPEMQVLDDRGHPDGKSPLTSAGAAYGIYAGPTDVVKPVGAWNSIRLIVSGDHVEHWMNGHKLLEYRLGSSEWAATVKASKFKEWPGYGKATSGFIGLQDHGDRVWFRNIRIQELP